MQGGACKNKTKQSSTKKTPKISKKLSPTTSNTVNGPCNHKDLYLWHRGSIYVLPNYISKVSVRYPTLKQRRWSIESVSEWRQNFKTEPNKIKRRRWSIESVSDWRKESQKSPLPDRAKFSASDQLSNIWLIGDRSIFRLKLEVVGRGWQKIDAIRRQNSVKKQGIWDIKFNFPTEPSN